MDLSVAFLPPNRHTIWNPNPYQTGRSPCNQASAAQRAPILKWEDYIFATVVRKNLKSLRLKNYSGKWRALSILLLILYWRIAGVTNWKNNTRANTAAIASRTRMRQNVTRILCIYDVIHGLVQRFRTFKRHSTHQRHLQRKQARVLRMIHVAIVARSFPTILNQIGINVLSIWLPCISLVNATTWRSSSERTTSDNISSIVMRGRLENGLTYSKMHAWRKNLKQSRDSEVLVKRAARDLS